MHVWHGVEPMLMRLHATDSVRLATPAEINDYWERRRRREVALGLINLATQIESGELPLGGYIDVCMSVKTLEIGRASCRERVWCCVGDAGLIQTWMWT